MRDRDGSNGRDIETLAKPTSWVEFDKVTDALLYFYQMDRRVPLQERLARFGQWMMRPEGLHRGVFTDRFNVLAHAAQGTAGTVYYTAMRGLLVACFGNATNQHMDDFFCFREVVLGMGEESDEPYIDMPGVGEKDRREMKDDLEENIAEVFQIGLKAFVRPGEMPVIERLLNEPGTWGLATSWGEEPVHPVRGRVIAWSGLLGMMNRAMITFCGHVFATTLSALVWGLAVIVSWSERRLTLGDAPRRWRGSSSTKSGSQKKFC